MSETSKNPQRTQKKQSRQAAKQAKRTQHEVVAERRTLSKKQREQQSQRRVLIGAGVAIGLALLALIIGVVYDQLWLPSRAVAQVNDTTLTRSEYWEQGRLSLAQQIAQNFQFLALFGSDEQFRSQFAGQSPGLNLQVETLRNQPENENIITNWQENQLAMQGAAELGVDVSDTEVTQRIAQDLGEVFLPLDTLEPAAPVTATDTLTGTDTLTATDQESEALSGVPTIAPTATARPTPEADVAADRVSQIVDRIYQQYTDELELVEQEPALAPDDFRQALMQQYRQQLRNRKIQETLVPEETFEPSTEPERVRARHILLRVDVPDDATEEEIDAAYAEREEEAEALVEALRDGADFAELAEEESDDPGSRDQGGDVGFFDEEGVSDTGATYAPAFVEAAFALEEDEISDPVRTPFGWHIIQVTERDVLDEEQQLRNARSEAFEEWLETLRAESAVRRFPEPTATVEGEIPGEGVPDPDAPTPVPTFLPGPPTPMPTLPPTPLGESPPGVEVPGVDSEIVIPQEP